MACMTGKGVRRLVEACAEETVSHFAAAILTYLRTISETALAGVEKDSDQLLSFFSKYVKVEKVGKTCAQCCTVRQLVGLLWMFVCLAVNDSNSKHTIGALDA